MEIELELNAYDVSGNVITIVQSELVNDAATLKQSVKHKILSLLRAHQAAAGKCYLNLQQIDKKVKENFVIDVRNDFTDLTYAYSF